MVEYRFLETLADQQLGRYLFDTVWPAPSEGTQIAPNFLQALMHSGSYLSGAFIDGEIVGAAFGFPAKDGDGTFYIHSHMAAVLPNQQDKGIGIGLKMHQKEWARNEGYKKIKWTFDPLVARNAWLNIGILKTKAVKYYVNFYGEMADAINAGDASDRILVEWDITENISPIIQKQSLEVEIPSDIVALRQNDIESARMWRKRVRDALKPKMDAGWQISDFRRIPNGNPIYILSEV
ncbi:MAG: hypothetical protein RLY74_331 [Actinomycetota bacterium]|jgi:predicted GNAT superfamily acetyltransferase